MRNQPKGAKSPECYMILNAFKTNGRNAQDKIAIPKVMYTLIWKYMNDNDITYGDYLFGKQPLSSLSFHSRRVRRMPKSKPVHVNSSTWRVRRQFAVDCRPLACSLTYAYECCVSCSWCVPSLTCMHCLVVVCCARCGKMRRAAHRRAPNPHQAVGGRRAARLGPSAQRQASHC